MKKIISILMIMFLSASFVSAGVFDWITGRAVNDCVDSDGGKDIYIKGTASEGGKENTDFCVSDTHVMEAYCSSAGLAGVRVRCFQGCKDGACIGKDEVVEEIEAEPEEEASVLEPEKTNEGGIDCSNVDFDDPYLDPECFWDTSHSLINGNCVEVIPNHNSADPNDLNRINLVFLGYDYSSVPVFKSVVETVTIGDGGLFTLEPFKSNMDKFNIWYVDGIHNVGLLEVPLIELMVAINARTSSIARTLKTTCNFENLYALNLGNVAGGKIAGGAGARYSITAGIPESEASLRSSVMIHELGHALGRLRDEYITTDLEYPSEPAPILTRNCFIASSKQECLENAPWKDLIGYGCGEDGVIDCQAEICYLEKLDQFGNPICRLENFSVMEVSCYEGCNYFAKGIWRPTQNSIMRTNQYGDKFNLVSIRSICNEIELATGSAGGICNDLPPVTPQPTTPTRPTPIPPEEPTEPEPKKCENSCLYESKCIPIGTRVDGEYCSLNRELESQLKAESQCNNNFECNSNLCISDKCVSRGLFNRILNWFSRLFG